MTLDEVYARRAERLAERPAAQTDRTTFASLAFGLGNERYAIDLAALAEVLPFRGCTEVPGAPPAVLGVINVRGDIKPVADLRRLLELPAGDASGGYVVMLRRADGAIGLRVDTVEGVRQLDSQTASNFGQAGAASRSRFIKAVVADTVIVIDTQAVLTALGL